MKWKDEKTCTASHASFGQKFLPRQDSNPQAQRLKPTLSITRDRTLFISNLSLLE